jgi:hypothetical protein
VSEYDGDDAVGCEWNDEKDGQQVRRVETVRQGCDLDGAAEEALRFVEFDKSRHQHLLLPFDCCFFARKSPGGAEKGEGKKASPEKKDYAALHDV